MALAQRLLPLPDDQHDAFTADCRRWVQEIERWRTILVTRLPEGRELVEPGHDAPVNAAECLADAATTLDMAEQWATGRVRQIPAERGSRELVDLEPESYLAKFESDL